MLELEQVKTRLLWLFSFIYDEDKIMRAKNGFHLNKKETVANAHEIIDLTVYKEIASKFNIIFEQAPVSAPSSSPSHLAMRVRSDPPLTVAIAALPPDASTSNPATATSCRAMWTSARNSPATSA